MPTSTSLDVLNRLRSEFSGMLVLAGEPDYDAARLPWNFAVDQRPVAVATPADVADVRAILRAAREAGLGVATQPRGHAAGADLRDAILVRTAAFDEIVVDVPARLVRVGSGVRWGSVLEQLEGTGHVALAGSNPEVSVVGLALNGGQSMFGRRYGLTARSIVAVELVDPAGGVRRVTDAEDPELMWALRGGGGRFGVVTAIELALFPGEQLFGGGLKFPARNAVDVVSAAFELARDVPELGLDVGMMRFPDMPPVPEPLRGQTVASVSLVHVGDEATGRSYADRLLAVAEPIGNTLTPFTIGALAAVAAEPTDPMPAADFGGSIATTDAAFAREFVDAFLAGAEHGLMRCSVRVLGGAIADELGADLAAVGAPQADGLLNAGVLLFDPSLDPSAAFEPLRALVVRHRGDRGVPTFLGDGSSLADAYPDDVLDRLDAVAQRMDPDRVLRGNRPLRP